MLPLEVIKVHLKSRVDDAAFENNWQQIALGYTKWKSSFESRNTSILNERLTLLKIICAIFPSANLYADKELSDLLLSDSGARNVGHAFKCRLPNGRAELTTIIRREITSEFGILYTLETAEGFRFTREFYD